MAKTTVLEPQSEEIALTQEQIEVVQKEINSTLVKKNVTDSLIKKYRDEYMGLTINGVEDKEGFEAVYSARQTAKNTRILVKNICTEGRATLQAKAKQWIAKQKELTAQIEEIEAHLQKQEDAYQAEKDRIKAERKAAEAKRLIDRTTLLTQIGVVFNGAEYVLDEVAYDLDVIRESDDKDWENIILPKYTAVFDAKETIRIAKQKADEEAERLRQAEAEKLRLAQQKLKDDQDKLDKENARIEQEKKDAKTLRSKKRSDQLDALGMVYNFRTSSFTAGQNRVAIPDTSLWLEDEEWDTLIKEQTPLISQAKKDLQAEQDAEEKARTDRKLAQIKEDEQRQKEADELKKKEEAERATDKQKVSNLIKQINALEIPVVTSRYWRDKINIIREKFEEINQL
jgi:hypothetical protein